MKKPIDFFWLKIVVLGTAVATVWLTWDRGLPEFVQYALFLAILALAVQLVIQGWTDFFKGDHGRNKE